MKKAGEWDFLGLLGSNLQESLVIIRDVLNGLGVSTNILKWLIKDGKKDFQEVLSTLVKKYQTWISDVIIPKETERILGMRDSFSAEIFFVEEIGPVQFRLGPGFRKFFGRKVEFPSSALWIERNQLRRPCFDIDILNRRGPVENLLVPLYAVYELILRQSHGEKGFLSIDDCNWNIFYCLDDRGVPRGLSFRFIAGIWELDAGSLENRGGGEWSESSCVFFLYPYK